jgi:WD40 repeat protein
MPASVVQCPHCHVSLKLKAAPQPGAKLKCPKCQQVFSPKGAAAAEDEFADLAPLPPRGGGLPPRVGAGSRSSKPAASKSKKKGSGSGAPVVLIVSILAGVFVLAGIGGGVYYWMNSQPSGTPVGQPVASNPSNGGTAPTVGVAPGTSGQPAANPAPGTTVSLAVEGAETPEVAYQSMSAAGSTGKMADMMKFVTPDSRKMFAVMAAMTIAEIKVPDARNKLKALFAKWKADIGPLERAMTAFEGKGRREVNDAMPGEIEKLKDPVPLAYFQAVQEFVQTEKPELFERGRQAKADKVVDLEITGDTAIGSVISQIEVHSKSFEEKETKTTIREERLPMYFVKLDGRWFVDLKKAESEREGGPPRKQPPQVVQKATLQSQTPQDVYASFLASLKGNDWKTHFETLSPDYQENMLMGVLLTQNEGSLQTLARWPNQSRDYDKRLLALLRQNGLTVDAVWKVGERVQSGMGLMPREFAEVKKQFAELLKPVKSQSDFYVALRNLAATANVPFIKKEHEKHSVVDAVIDGDKAIVVLRDESHPKSSPQGFALYPAVRVNGKWYVADKPGGVPPTLPPEVLQKYLEKDQSLVDTISAAKPQYSDHPPSVYALAISPDGQLLFTGGYSDQSLYIWDMATRKEKAVVKDVGGHIRTLTFSADGKVLVATLNGELNAVSNLAVLDPVAGTLLKKIPAPGKKDENSIEATTVTTNGKLGFAVMHSGQLHKFDLTAGKLLKTATIPHFEQFRAVSVSPDGSQVSSAQLDKFLRVWDVASLKENTTKQLSTADRKEGYHVSHDVAFSPDGRGLAIAYSNEIQIFEPKGKNFQKRIIHPKTDPRFTSSDVRKIRWSPDSVLIATIADDFAIRIWNVSTGSVVQTLSGHATMVHVMDFTKDGKMLVSGDENGAIKFWKLR